jgi:hypothetical protein
MNKLELYYPVRPFIKYQSFGTSDACSQISHLPVTQRKVVSKVEGLCPIGFEELYPILGMKGHTGVDMFGGHGYPCHYSGKKGIVQEIQSEPERGLGLGIITTEAYSFEGGEYHAKTRYWHLKGFNVSLGDEVSTGQLIGWCDNTGLSSGDHLHYELKPVLKNSDGIWYNVFQNNGYFGSVNPQPYFNTLYAVDQSLSSFDTNLSFGMENDGVEQLQKALKALGYFRLNYTTKFYGSVTRKAVLDFQLNEGVITFGVESLWGWYFGPKTRARINNLIRK